MDSGEAAVPALISCGDDAMLGGDAFRHTPQRSQLDVVNAISPRIPLRQHRLIQSIGELHPVEIIARESPHLREHWFYLAQHTCGQRAR